MKTLFLALLLCVSAFAQNNQNNFGGTSGSGNGTGSGASPIIGDYLGPNCPAANTGRCFYTPANTQVVGGCSWTNASTTITCPSGTFTSTAVDGGKLLWGFTSTNPFVVQPTTGAIATSSTHPTIATITDSAHAVISATPANTCAGGTGNDCEIVFGTPDDTGAAAVETAYASLASTPTCPRLFFGSGGYMFTTTHFTTNPAACLAVPELAHNPPFTLGNVFLTGGFEWEGRGPGATMIWLPMDFPESGSCNHGVSGLDCFVVPLEGRLSNIQFSCGSGDCSKSLGAGVALLGLDVGSAEYVTLTGWADQKAGSGSNQHLCMDVTHWGRMQHVNISGCGDVNMKIENTAVSTGFRVSLENANGLATGSGNLWNLGDFTCLDCQFFGAQSTDATSDIVGQGASSITRLYYPRISTQNGANNFYYQCITTLGCQLTIQDGVTATGATNNTGIFCGVTCTVDLTRTKIVGAGTAAPINIISGSTLIDRGGNVYTGGTASTNVGSSNFLGHSVSGACTGVGTAASTLGLYGTGPNETLTTCTSTTIGTGTPMQGAGTLYFLSATASAAGTNASSGVVTVLKNGSTTTITCTIGTGTSCSDYTHQVSYVAGDLISLQFTTQAADTLAGVKATVAF